MRRNSMSGLTFGLRMTDAMGWAPVLAVPRSQIVRVVPRASVFLIAVTLLLASAPPARAVPFLPNVFTIFQSTDSDVSSFGIPAINESGKIAVVVRLDSNDQQVRTYSEVNNPTIIVTEDNSSRFIDGASINNNDTVVYFEHSNSLVDNFLFASKGGLISTVVDDLGAFNIDGIPISGLSAFDWDLADNADVVVFHAFLDSGGGGRGIYQRNLAEPEFFTRINANPSEFGFSDPAVNAQGRMAVIMSFIGSQGLPSRQQILSCHHSRANLSTDERLKAIHDTFFPITSPMPMIFGWEPIL